MVEELHAPTVRDEDRRVVVYGGSFNPPTKQHRAIAKALAKRFDRVYIVPCGPRPDKEATNDIPANFRAAMVDKAFAGIQRVEVALFDLEASVFTPLQDLDGRFGHRERVWFVVNERLVQGGATGSSEIQQQWTRGAEMWRELQFVVLQSQGSSLLPDDLPPKAQVLEVQRELPAELRGQLFSGHRRDDLLPLNVGEYIQRHRLYRATHPPRSTSLHLAEIRPLVVWDKRNPKAEEIARAITPVGKPHNLIVVVGGDGMMLRAIRKHWRRRLPFFGINAGHMGFLLNDGELDFSSPKALVVQQLPLLWVEIRRAGGQIEEALAFNDAWVERASGQTAWLEVRVNGQTRLPKLVADGALISTAAGSTSYARAMGASPLPLTTPALLLVGSNVLRPIHWKPAVLPLDAEVEIRALDPDKRPLRGFIDGTSYHKILSLRARVSRAASIELAFLPNHDPSEKIARIQFPLVEA